MSSKSDHVYSVTGRGGGRDSRDRRGNWISELSADKCKMSEMFKQRAQTPPRPNCGLLFLYKKKHLLPASKQCSNSFGGSAYVSLSVCT